MMAECSPKSAQVDPAEYTPVGSVSRLCVQNSGPSSAVLAMLAALQRIQPDRPPSSGRHWGRCGLHTTAQAPALRPIVSGTAKW
jgi:hypothetical protein